MLKYYVIAVPYLKIKHEIFLIQLWSTYRYVKKLVTLNHNYFNLPFNFHILYCPLICCYCNRIQVHLIDFYDKVRTQQEINTNNSSTQVIQVCMSINMQIRQWISSVQEQTAYIFSLFVLTLFFFLIHSIIFLQCLLCHWCKHRKKSYNTGQPCKKN